MQAGLGAVMLGRVVAFPMANKQVGYTGTKQCLYSEGLPICTLRCFSRFSYSAKRLRCVAICMPQHETRSCRAYLKLQRAESTKHSCYPLLYDVFFFFSKIAFVQLLEQVVRPTHSQAELAYVLAGSTNARQVTGPPFAFNGFVSSNEHVR